MAKLMAKKTGIGLDIGSSAVRAAEVVVDGERRVLRRFAQVGLPQGAVVEGEVRDRGAVSAALRKLWQHGGFASRRVVVGLGSQRTMVRQVEMPQMPDEELRSALRYKLGEFLPIPVDQAVVDFASVPGPDGPKGTRRVLLVAAQKDVVVDEIAAVEQAGLRVAAVDSSALALLRAVRPQGGGPGKGDGGGGLEAVVGVGAQLMTVAVREAGVARFVRTVALAVPATADLSDQMAMAPAGDLSRRAANRSVVPAGAPEPEQSKLDAVVTEVRSSLEYIVSQSHSGQFSRLLVTGGGAMLPGLATALGAAVGVPVKLAEVPLELDYKSMGLEPEAVEEASSRWATAVGLALWGTDGEQAPSLVPPEVFARRQARKAMTAAAAVVGVVALALGGAAYARVHTASNLSHQIALANQEAGVLQVKIKKLGYVMAVPEAVRARRQLAAQALVGDIDWTGLLERIARALPASVTVQSVELTKTEPTTVGGTAPAKGAVVGNITMTAQTTGGAAAVAEFIDRVSVVKGLEALWVSSTTKSTGLTAISASAQVTTAAFSNRAALLPGGTK